MSVMASIARVTWYPSSCAWRAVDSTPMLVATPAITTWVTPSFFRCSFRPVLVKAPHVCLVTVWSSGCRFRSGTRSVHPAGKPCVSRLFRSAGCAAGYVDQHDGQVVAAKGVRQGARVLDDFGGWVCGGQRDDAFLQIDDDQSCLLVKRG